MKSGVGGTGHAARRRQSGACATTVARTFHRARGGQPWRWPAPGAHPGKAGHQVTWFADGLSALSGLEGRKPHAILLDIGLPGLDGYAVLAMIKMDANLGSALLIKRRPRAGDDLRSLHHNVGRSSQAPHRPRDALARKPWTPRCETEDLSREPRVVKEH